MARRVVLFTALARCSFNALHFVGHTLRFDRCAYGLSRRLHRSTAPFIPSRFSANQIAVLFPYGKLLVQSSLAIWRRGFLLGNAMLQILFGNYLIAPRTEIDTGLIGAAICQQGAYVIFRQPATGGKHIHRTLVYSHGGG